MQASTTETIATLVHGFAKHIKELKAPEYKESQVRLNYIDPFWTLLGWDVRNAAQHAPQDVEVVVEPSMDSVDDQGFRARQPDYLFRVNGFARFVVEAKKPSVDLDTDKRAIFQAKRYAWSAAIPFAILTDFEQFRLYDTTLKPDLNDPDRGKVNEFALDFQHYPEQWDVLTETFGRDAVASGSLEALRGKIRKVPAGRRLRTIDRTLTDLRGDEPVDRVFLAYLDTHRRHFAREIYRQNKKLFPEADTLHGAARLTEAVQRLMDRLVFMRVCEDRGIGKWGALRDTWERIGTEGGDLFAALCDQFRELDRSYNGYLFKHHPLTDALQIDGDVLADFIRTLYPPDGPWDFSAIADDILGIVYERFLSNVVTVKRHQVDVVEKPEVRHAGGVYYTPRFVVDTIIRRVVGPQIAGRTPQQVLDVKILDPACGSGSFLVAAFQYLIDHCLAAVAADPSLGTMPATPKARKKRKDIAFKNKKGDWHLAPDFKAALLTSCLHGVDIDQQAVEVTVMSLYLKMLEGALPPNWQRDWLENELLPPLDNNIQCGNSLIDETDYDRYLMEKPGALYGEDADTKFRINRFDWTSRTRGFGRLLDAQAVNERGRTGFDGIIGNPPYIRVQELKKWAPQECEFYKWNYKSAAKGNYDIYVVFTEKCLSLLAPDGLLGFIMPHKFWQAKYGEGLRKVIAEGKHLKSVVDFGHQQVFLGATTYTAIHLLSRKRNPDGINYARFDDLSDGAAQCAELDSPPRRPIPGVRRFKTDHPGPDTAPFRFADARNLVQVDGTKRLDEVADLAQGLKTGADKVFVVEFESGDASYAVIRSQATGRLHTIESASLRSLVKSEHMKQFDLRQTSMRLVFPYVRDGSKWRLLTPEEMRSRFPLLWKDYLLPLRPVLRKREKGRFDDDRFYQFSRPQNFEALSRPKIINPDICQRPQMCWDETGDHVFSGGAAGGVAIVPRVSTNAALLLGILNSKLTEYLIRINGTPFRGGYLNCEIRFIRDLPIKLPTTADDKKLAGRIIESVRILMDAKAKLRGATPSRSGAKGRRKPVVLSDRDTKSLEAEIEAHEKRIDNAVFALYGVDGLPAQ